MNDSTRRKLKYGSLYGKPECPGAGVRFSTPRMLTWIKENERTFHKRRESARFEKRHGYKRDHYEILRDEGGGNDGGSPGFE